MTTSGSEGLQNIQALLCCVDVNICVDHQDLEVHVVAAFTVASAFLRNHSAELTLGLVT